MKTRQNHSGHLLGISPFPHPPLSMRIDLAVIAILSYICGGSETNQMQIKPRQIDRGKPDRGSLGVICMGHAQSP